MPISRLPTVGSRAFPVAGPQTWWNDLPEDVTSAQSLTTFHRLLKTHLFRKSFPDYLLDINWLSLVDLAVVPLLKPPKKLFEWLIDWFHKLAESPMLGVLTNIAKPVHDNKNCRLLADNNYSDFWCTNTWAYWLTYHMLQYWHTAATPWGERKTYPSNTKVLATEVEKIHRRHGIVGGLSGIVFDEAITPATVKSNIIRWTIKL